MRRNKVKLRIRRSRALDYLVFQLKAGYRKVNIDRTTISIPLTEGNKKRLSKEIEILTEKIK